MTPTTHPTKRGEGPIAETWHDDAGVTAIEYALIAACIVIGALVGFTAFGTALNNLYTTWISAAIAAIAG